MTSFSINRDEVERKFQGERKEKTQKKKKQSINIKRKCLISIGKDMF